MNRSEAAFDQFTLRGVFLLVTFLAIWVGITILLGTFSLFFWTLAVFMATILRPAHQRRPIPESVTDAVSVAIVWAVAWGVVGFAMDFLATSDWQTAFLPWTLLGQLMGFYMGMVWVLILLVYRHLARAAM